MRGRLHVYAFWGALLSLAWIDAPRALVAAGYVLVGWAALAAVPRLPEQLSTAPLLLLAAGAALYIAGAAVYASRRPNPWPAVFGFHEVFHGLVVLAAISHFLAFAGWIVPSASAS